MSSTLSKLALSVSCQSYCVNIACCELHRDGLVFSKHITQVIVAREYVVCLEMYASAETTGSLKVVFAFGRLNYAARPCPRVVPAQSG